MLTKIVGHVANPHMRVAMCGMVLVGVLSASRNYLEASGVSHEWLIGMTILCLGCSIILVLTSTDDVSARFSRLFLGVMTAGLAT